MEIVEIKITRKQYITINRLIYNPEEKNKYIVENIISDKYELSPDVHFSTYYYKDNYFLFFDGEKKPSNKWKIFDVKQLIENEKLKEQE